MADLSKPGVTFQPTAGRKLLEGARKIVGAVAPTLGPNARSVVHQDLGGNIEFLDDAGSIARRIVQISDREADMGAMYARHLLWTMRERVGDGAATAAVVFQSVLDGGHRVITAGANPVRLRHHLERVVDEASADLASQTMQLHQVTGSRRQALELTARSTCNDPELAVSLAACVDVIGSHGRFDTRRAMDRCVRHSFVEGSYWAGSTHSKAALPAKPAGRTELIHAGLVMGDAKVESLADLVHLDQVASEAGVTDLVVFTPSISDEMLGAIRTGRHGTCNLVPVKLGTADVGLAAETFGDIAVMAGGRPTVTAAGQSVRSVTVDDVGRTRRFWVDADHFGISGGQGDPMKRRERVAALRAAYDDSDDQATRNRLLPRLGRLLGGTAVIHIGGTTETEIKNREAVVDRTVRVLRAAVSSGVLRGGGVALLRCRDSLLNAAADDDSSEFEAQVAFEIVAAALEAPARTLAHNAGLEPAEFMSDGITAPDVFDVASVQIEAVERAVRGAALLLTSEALVRVRQPEVSLTP